MQTNSYIYQLLCAHGAFISHRDYIIPHLRAMFSDNITKAEVFLRRFQTLLRPVFIGRYMNGLCACQGRATHAKMCGKACLCQRANLAHAHCGRQSAACAMLALHSCAQASFAPAMSCFTAMQSKLRSRDVTAHISKSSVELPSPRCLYAISFPPHCASALPCARALHIICVMVPIGQYTHQERGLNSTMVTMPSTVDVSMTL